MKYTKIISLLLLVFALALTACGGGDSADAPEAPAVELGEEMRVEEGGYAFSAPVGYESSVDFIFAELSDPENADTEISLIGTPLEEGMTIDTVYEGFTAEFSGDETVTIGERETVTINGLEGISVTMEGDEEGTTIKGQMIVLGNETQAVFIFGGSNASSWDESVSAEFDAIANSISMFEPALTE